MKTSSAASRVSTGVEEALLVLLHVAVVGQRQALHDGQQTDQVAVYPARLPPRELGDVGVSLLGHHAAASRVLVSKPYEGELVGRPEDELLGQPGEVHHGDGGGGVKIDHEVPVGDRVHAVCGDGGEAELFGDAFAVYGIGNAGEGAAAEGHHVRHLVDLPKPLAVASQHLEVGEHVVGKQDGLGPLHVGVAGHDRAGVLIGLVHEHGPEAMERRERPVHGVLGVHSHVEGDLVVAGAGGVQAPGGLTDLLEETALDVHVDVVEVLAPREGSPLDLAADLDERLLDRQRLLSSDDVPAPQHTHVSNRPGDVLPVQSPVVVD